MIPSMREVTLSELLEDIRPGFASGKDDPDGVVQFRMNNVRVDGSVDFSKLRRVPKSTKNLATYALKPGDVLFNATNSPDLVGKTALFDGFTEPVVFSNHFLRLRADPASADGAYMARWMQLQFSRGVFASLCHQWVNQATVTRERLLSLKIPLPPLEEQRRIAEILDKAEALRAKRRRAIARLDTLAQSIFIEMFGDAVTNPKRWPIQSLGEVGALDRGVSKHRPRNAPGLLGGPYPLIQTGDVANCDHYISIYTQTYSELGLKQSRMWPRGTLCITIAANIAKTGILEFDACFPDSVVGFTPGEFVTTEYVQYWLSFLQSHLEEIAPESAQKNINLAILRDLNVPVPPKEMQCHFSKHISRVVQLKERQERSLQANDALFASLQHRAFRGEL